MELPKRKSTRLEGYDYSSPGAYFITICTKDRKHLLSEITVGDGGLVFDSVGDKRLPPATIALDVPQNILTPYGEAAKKYIEQLSEFYHGICIDKYVIMPNHIHFILNIKSDGTSRTPSPTNSTVSKFISTFKRFCNKEYGRNIWQRMSNDHIIRGEDDYQKIWEYIDTNVLRWEKDCFYDQ